MAKIEKICKGCSNTFLVEIREVNKGQEYCSRNCFNKNRPLIIKEPNCICGQCKVNFYKNPSSMKNSKSGIYFCSRKCKDESQIIGGIKEIQPGHYNDNKSNYRKIIFRIKPKKCESCGYDKITDILEVHHIDENRHNNTIENLQVLCPNCHCEEHFKSKSGKWRKSK